ncbi:M56 family metallopeptidase [bacterium]|nr:MAG: M56 family metallopeptidase [bacterium]
MIEALFRAAVQGCLLALVVWALSRLLPARARTRCWLWWLVLAQFAFGWLAFAPVSLGTPEALAESPFARALQPQTGTGMPEVSVGISEESFPSLLAILWIAGVVTVIGSRVVGTIQLLRLRRAATPAPEAIQRLARRIAAEMGLSAPPPVLLSNAIGSPAAFGLFRPCVLLPNHPDTLDENDLEMVLTHEIAHLVRRDPLFALVPEIAVAVFWFFPPVYLVRREWTIQRELACDEAVYERTACPTKAYRRLLLKVVQADGGRMPKGAFGATADFHCLKRRLLAGPPTNAGRTTGTLAILLVAALSFPIALQAPRREAGLLRNASFESGRIMPDSWIKVGDIEGVDYRWDDGVAHTGNRSLSIRKRADRYFPIARWTQTIPYDGRSKAIEFSGWVKTKDAYKAVLDVEFESRKGDTTHQWAAYIGAERLGDLPANHDWQLTGGTVPIPKGTETIVLSLQMYGPGQVWLDDVSARFLAKVPASREYPE